MKINTICLPSLSNSARALGRLTTAFACCVVLGLLAGCATEPESHVVSAPPPPDPTRSVTTTTTTTQNTIPGNVIIANPTPAVGTTIVTVAPPALQTEVVLAQPAPGYVWLAGCWTWRNEEYEWRAGHWQMPPNSSSVWVAPRWEQQGNAYKFTEGYWN